MTDTADRDYQAVVLAAGKGTRMRSALPKVLHRVCGLTLLERSLRALNRPEITRVVVVAGFESALVIEECERLRATLPQEIVVVIQSEQRGTGHAVSTALPALKETPSRTIIIPGDVPLLDTDTIDSILADDGEELFPDLLIVSCELPDPSGFGRVVRDDGGNFHRIVEDKDCSAEELEIAEINAAIYCAELSLLREMLPKLTPANNQGELYFTDVAEHALKASRRVSVSCVEEWTRVTGANSRTELSQLEQLRREEINLSWLEQGVSFEDVASVYIDEDVTLGRDVFLGAGTRLQGKSALSDGVVIEGQSMIRNSSIGNGVTVKLSCYLDSAEVGDGCKIGPFAHLRPGTKLHRDVHIGNFVETKQSELFNGVKANHLTYLGDATIGERTNIGAGTITCNYDGYKKHRTTIKAGVFVGSNTSIVAPVTLEEGAVTGAGSVITKDVPADSLAIERGEQRHFAGWAKKRREQNSLKK